MYILKQNHNKLELINYFTDMKNIYEELLSKKRYVGLCTISYHLSILDYLDDVDYKSDVYSGLFHKDFTQTLETENNRASSNYHWDKYDFESRLNFINKALNILTNEQEKTN